MIDCIWGSISCLQKGLFMQLCEAPVLIRALQLIPAVVMGNFAPLVRPIVTASMHSI